MEIDVQARENAVIVHVIGTLDMQSSPDLGKILKKHAEEARRQIMVDLSRVDYMDSSGVGVLISGLKLARRNDVPFSLINVAPRVLMVIEMTRLTQLFRIFPNVETALQPPP